MEKEPEPFSEEKAEVVMEDESMAEEKEMSEERVKDILKKTKERVLFDAKLIQGSAHYVLDQGSQDFRLEPTEKQVKEIKKESNYTKQEQRYIILCLILIRYLTMLPLKRWNMQEGSLPMIPRSRTTLLFCMDERAKMRKLLTC